MVGNRPLKARLRYLQAPKPLGSYANFGDMARSLAPTDCIIPWIRQRVYAGGSLVANQVHADWLQEGVTAWNDRRATDKFEPDLSGIRLDMPTEFRNIDLRGANLTGAALAGVDLREANLAQADLQEVDAFNVRFDNAILVGANMQNARLFGSDFSNAILQRANLTGADLDLANLTDADLRFAVVSGAHLDTTILSRTNTLGAKLWQARLYPESCAPAQWHDEGAQVTIESVADLMSEVHKLETGIPLYFRGEQRCGRKLTPSVFREGFTDVEDKLLNDLISQRPEEMGSARTALEQLQMAQHYGHKTRLLDITKNPLVALYFACEASAEHDKEDGCLHIFAVPAPLVKAFNSDTISVLANFVKLPTQDKRWLLSREGLHPQRPFSARNNYSGLMTRLYERIREEKPNFSERIEMKDLYGVFVVEPQQNDERIRAQHSAFLLSAVREEFDYQGAEEWNSAVHPYEHYCLRVESKRKGSILNDLRLMGLSRQSLFPGLESSAKEVMRRYRT